MIYTKIVLPNYNVVQKSTGLPSGNVFTSIIGSIVNYIVLNETLLEIGLKNQDYDILVYGDDSLIGFERKINGKEIAHQRRG